MTLTIHLEPDTEAGLLAQAEAAGLDVPHYVEKLVRMQALGQAGMVAASRPAYERSTEEWLSEFDAWVKSHAVNTVVLSGEAMRRESIYGDRGA